MGSTGTIALVLRVAGISSQRGQCAGLGWPLKLAQAPGQSRQASLRFSSGLCTLAQNRISLNRHVYPVRLPTMDHRSPFTSQGTGRASWTTLEVATGLRAPLSPHPFLIDIFQMRHFTTVEGIPSSPSTCNVTSLLWRVTFTKWGVA